MGIHELKTGLRETVTTQEEREQERETMDKIPYTTANLQKLVRQVTLCGRVLASTINILL